MDEEKVLDTVITADVEPEGKKEGAPFSGFVCTILVSTAQTTKHKTIQRKLGLSRCNT